MTSSSRSTSRCFSIASTRLASASSGSGELRDLRGVAPKLRASMVSNPVTGEAYLLLDVPENPPPPMTLAFTPDRPYVPWVPTTMATVQDRLPAILERAEATLQISHGDRQQRFPRASTGAIDFSRTSSASFRRASSRR